MSEIEKMYELVQPAKRCDTYGTFGQCPHKTWKCEECTSFVYRPFTAEKQIELIKWLAQKDCYSCDYTEIKPRDNNNEWMSNSVFKTGYAHTFEEALANLINNLWQSLTEEEKQQIKEILE